MPSLYCSYLNPNDSHISLEGEEFHHLAHVKRISIGQGIKLSNGKGLIAEGIIKELTKKSAVLEITSHNQTPYPTNSFAIAFALLKNKHDELLVEKCTELGASAFLPLVTDFSVRNPSANTLMRFERIALAAIKQCDNPWLPKVFSPVPLRDSLAHILSNGYNPVLCSERRPDKRISDLEITNPCFIIGPEGGFSEAEIGFIEQQNIPQISICSLITRAETAAIAIAAQFAGSRK